MRNVSTDVCPTCGTPRMGSFRFCRSCGFDYDASVSVPPAAMPGVLAPAPVAGPAAPPDPPSALSTPPQATGAIGAQTPAPGAIGTQPPAGGPVGAKPSADDVVVVKVRDLKLATGAIFGGLIGAMITGAFIVPGLGAERLAVAVVLGILTILASAALGARAGLAFIGH